MHKSVEGYPNYYMDSEGNIFSNVYKKMRKLIPETTKAGYLRVQLYRDGKVKKVLVHRLVALAFIPNPKDKPHVNHLDGDKTNNRVINLEWCNRSENMRHAISNGLRPEGSNRGEKHGNSKLTSNDVLKIRELKGVKTKRQIAENFGIHMNTVALIWSRKLWYWL